MQTRRGKEASVRARRSTKLPSKFDQYLLPSTQGHKPKSKHLKSAKRGTGIQLATAAPRKQNAAATLYQHDHVLKQNHTARAPETKRLVIKLGGQPVTLPVDQQAHLQQVPKPGCISHPAEKRCAQPAAATTATGQNPHTAGRSTTHRAATVERPVTRRFKLQQTSSLRVRLKLRTPAGSSTLRSRPSSLRHQQKRQISKPNHQHAGQQTPAAITQVSQEPHAAEAVLQSHEDTSITKSCVPVLHSAMVSPMQTVPSRLKPTTGPQQAALYAEAHPAAAVASFTPDTETMKSTQDRCPCAYTCHDLTDCMLVGSPGCAVLGHTAHEVCVPHIRSPANTYSTDAANTLGASGSAGMVPVLRSMTAPKSVPAAIDAASLLRRSLKRSAPCDFTAPYKLIAVNPNPKHTPVMLHSPVAAACNKRRRLTQGIPSSTHLGHPCPSSHASAEQHGIACTVQDQQQWRQQQRALLQHTLQQTVAGLRQPLMPGSTSQGLTSSSVSYMVPSCSKQVGVQGGLAYLPHLVIRPPNLRQSNSCTVHQNLQCLQSQEVLTMRMPLKDDAAIKEYVLRPPHRAQLLSSACFSTQPSCQKGQGTCTGQGLSSRQDCPTDQGFSTGQGISSGQGPCLSEGSFPGQNASKQGCQGCPHCMHTRAVAASGATWRSIVGVDAIQPLLMEPSFVCMHYKLGPGAQLQACAPEVKGPEDSARQQYARAAQQSNVQVGLHIRRGIGGTCPAKAAARQPALQALLSGLLVPCPVATTASALPATAPVDPIIHRTALQSAAPPASAPPSLAFPPPALPDLALPAIAPLGPALPAMAPPGSALPAIALLDLALPATAPLGPALPVVAHPGSALPAMITPESALPAVTAPLSAPPAIPLPGSALPGVTPLGSTCPAMTPPGSALPAVTFDESALPIMSPSGSSVSASCVPAALLSASSKLITDSMTPKLFEHVLPCGSATATQGAPEQFGPSIAPAQTALLSPALPIALPEAALSASTTPTATPEVATDGRVDACHNREHAATAPCVLQPMLLACTPGLTTASETPTTASEIPTTASEIPTTASETPEAAVDDEKHAQAETAEAAGCTGVQAAGNGQQANMLRASQSAVGHAAQQSSQHGDQLNSAPAGEQLQPALKFQTISIRLELYVDQAAWKSLNRCEQDILYSSITALEQQLQAKAQAWSQTRLLHYCHRLQTSVSNSQNHRTAAAAAAAASSGAGAAAAATAAAGDAVAPAAAVAAPPAAVAAPAELSAVSGGAAATAGMMSGIRAAAGYPGADAGSQADAGAAALHAATIKLVVDSDEAVQVRLHMCAPDSSSCSVQPNCCLLVDVQQLTANRQDINNGDIRAEDVPPQGAFSPGKCGPDVEVPSNGVPDEAAFTGSTTDGSLQPDSVQDLHNLTRVSPSRMIVGWSDHCTPDDSMPNVSMPGPRTPAHRTPGASKVEAGVPDHGILDRSNADHRLRGGSLSHVTSTEVSTATVGRQDPNMQILSQTAQLPVSRDLSVATTCSGHASQITSSPPSPDTGTTITPPHTLTPPPILKPTQKPLLSYHPQSCVPSRTQKPQLRAVSCTLLPTVGVHPPSLHAQAEVEPGMQLPALESRDAATLLVQAAAAAAGATSEERAQAGPFPWPYYFIGTRDSFTYELVQKKETVCAGGRTFLKTEFFFKPGELPDNYHQVVGHKQHPHASPNPSQVPIPSPEQQHTQQLPGCTPPPAPFQNQSNATLVSSGRAEQHMHSSYPPASDLSCSSPAQSTVHAQEQMPHIRDAVMPRNTEATSSCQPRSPSSPGTAAQHDIPCGVIAQPLQDLCASGHVGPVTCVMPDDHETCKAQSLQSPLLATAQTALDPKTPAQLQHSLPVRLRMPPFAAAAGTAVTSPTHSTAGNGMFNLHHQPAASRCESGSSDLSDGIPGLLCQTADHQDQPSTQTMNAAVIGTELLPVGITTYTEFFGQEELQQLEANADAINSKAEAQLLPPACFCTSAGKSGAHKRTKFFFGARYLWTRDQMQQHAAKRAHGIRVDVPSPPQWMQEQVQEPMTQSGLLPDNFINSYALNMYHDGSEGIQSHYDDADRFSRPIYSLRLFSDSRMSFGTQLYGYTNGAFCVDMPRGCMTVMEKGGYAAAGVKHCVRPMDMTGKSAGMILRQINPEALTEAHALHYDETCHMLQQCSLTAEQMPEATETHSHLAPAQTSRPRAEADQQGTLQKPHTDSTQIRKAVNAMLKQVTAEFKAERRAAKQVQTEQREVRRCMERMLSHVEAKERAIDCEVHLVTSRMLHNLEYQLSPPVYQYQHHGKQQPYSAVKATVPSGNALAQALSVKPDTPVTTSWKRPVQAASNALDQVKRIKTGVDCRQAFPNAQLQPMCWTPPLPPFHAQTPRLPQRCFSQGVSQPPQALLGTAQAILPPTPLPSLQICSDTQPAVSTLSSSVTAWIQSQSQLTLQATMQSNPNAALTSPRHSIPHWPQTHTRTQAASSDVHSRGVRPVQSGVPQAALLGTVQQVMQRLATRQGTPADHPGGVKACNVAHARPLACSRHALLDQHCTAPVTKQHAMTALPSGSVAASVAESAPAVGSRVSDSAQPVGSEVAEGQCSEPVANVKGSGISGSLMNLLMHGQDCHL